MAGYTSSFLLVTTATAYCLFSDVTIVLGWVLPGNLSNWQKDSRTDGWCVVKRVPMFNESILDTFNEDVSALIALAKNSNFTICEPNVKYQSDFFSVLWIQFRNTTSHFYAKTDKLDFHLLI